MLYLFFFHFHLLILIFLFFFFFNDTATTEIYTLSLHDALPFWGGLIVSLPIGAGPAYAMLALQHDAAFRSEEQRLNSSHVEISYAVFCLKKKKKKDKHLFVYKKKTIQKNEKNTDGYT